MPEKKEKANILVYKETIINNPMRNLYLTKESREINFSYITDNKISLKIDYKAEPYLFVRKNNNTHYIHSSFGLIIGIST